MTKMKASYNENRQCLGEILPLDTPLSVILDVSERCNFKCSYCFRSQPKDETWGYAAQNNLMSMDIFQKAVRQLSEFPRRITSISLSGHGEPLCNPGLAAMVQHLKGSGVTERIEMHTNASLLTPVTAKEFARSGLTRMVVSLQGLNAETYKKVCGAALNWDSFYRCLGILYENKASDFTIHIKISEAALDPNRYEEEEAAFYSLFGGIADTVSVEKVTPLWKNLAVKGENDVNKYGQSMGEIQCCPILFYKIWVAPDGSIYPCTGLPAPMSLGTIQQLSLLDAWNGQERRDFLAAHLRSPRGGCDACMDCFVPVNTVTMDKDQIDTYKADILSRLEGETQ